MAPKKVKVTRKKSSAEIDEVEDQEDENDDEDYVAEEPEEDDEEDEEGEEGEEAEEEEEVEDEEDDIEKSSEIDQLTDDQRNSSTFDLTAEKVNKVNKMASKLKKKERKITKAVPPKTAKKRKVVKPKKRAEIVENAVATNSTTSVEKDDPIATKKGKFTIHKDTSVQRIKKTVSKFIWDRSLYEIEDAYTVQVAMCTYQVITQI